MNEKPVEHEPYRSPIPGEPVYNLMEAAELIGRTTGLFYAEKTKQRLQELGCRTGGRDGWRIHQSALVEMGWLTFDGEPTGQVTKRPRKPSGAPKVVTDVSDADPFAMMNASKEDLVREVLRLRSELATSDGVRTVLEKDIDRLQGQVDAFLKKLS